MFPRILHPVKAYRKSLILKQSDKDIKLPDASLSLLITHAFHRPVIAIEYNPG